MSLRAGTILLCAVPSAHAPAYQVRRTIDKARSYLTRSPRIRSTWFPSKSTATRRPAKPRSPSNALLSSGTSHRTEARPAIAYLKKTDTTACTRWACAARSG